MRRDVADILRENCLVFERGGEEFFSYIVERNGVKCATREKLYNGLYVEDGYQMVDRLPTGRCIGCSIGLTRRQREYSRADLIEDAVRRVYLNIMLCICKERIFTTEQIKICIEETDLFIYVRGCMLLPKV
jgi:hypothetical protein